MDELPIQLSRKQLPKLRLRKNLGDAVCYYLGHLGIHAEYKRDKRKHRWRSQNSPLLTWIKHICLGLSPKQLTTYTSITAPWLYSAPKALRLKFLQSLNDGDGYANTKYQKLGNACGVNSDFLIEFLSTLGVNSRFLVNRVIIEQQASVIHAVELPFFLHATGRQAKANKLAKMMAARSMHSGAPLHWKAEYYFKQLAKEGKSPGEIVEIVFDKLGICYYPGRVRKFIEEEAVHD